MSTAAKLKKKLTMLRKIRELLEDQLGSLKVDEFVLNQIQINSLTKKDESWEEDLDRLCYSTNLENDDIFLETDDHLFLTELFELD